MENVNLGIDSTSWVETKWERTINRRYRQTFNPGAIPTSDIEKITAINHGRGVQDGLAYGFLAGVAAAVGVWVVIEESRAYFGKDLIIAAIPLCGVAGAIIGLMIGATIGHTDKYVLNLSVDSTSNDIEVEKN